MIDLSATAYAALPQNAEQHLPELLQADRTRFDQADHHPHLLDQLRVLRLGQSRGDLGGARSTGWLWRGRRRWVAQDLDLAALPLVLAPLVLAPLGVLVIGGAAPNGLPPPVLLLAAKRAAQVAAPGVAGMREKKDAAMPATAQALAQVRLGAQSRSQEHVILSNQRGHCGLSIPAPPELKKLRDPYCKKPKLSLKVLM